MILIGFALDSLILALRTPAGFIASIFSLGFLEKRAAQSIIKDTDTTKIRNFFEHIKNRVPPIKSQQRKYNI
jgi:hypothetical protein